MKPVLWIFASCVIALTFSSCGNSGGGGNPGGPQAVTGPYDRNGNYVEAWADDPSKWRKSGGSSPHERKSDELPEIAVNEQPPQNAVPLPQGNPTKTVPVISQTDVAPRPKSTSDKSDKVVVRKKRPVDDDDKPTVRTKPKPKPKTTTVKAKPKPKSTRYVVKKGDSLSSIASKTGASVSAIKSANGISGSLIRPGQSLTIPKK